MVRIHRIHTARKFFIIFFTLCISLSYFTAFLAYSPTTKSSFDPNPQANPTSELPNSPINTDGVQPIGNITVETINYLAEGIMDTSVGINPSDISLTYIEYEWQGVQQITQDHDADNWESDIEIRMKETVQFDYEITDTLTLLGYKPELSFPNKGDVISMSINSIPVDLNDVEISPLGGFIYNYSTYHESNPEDTLIVDYVYDYNITIKQLRLIQKRYPIAPVDSAYIDLYSSTNIKSYYNYTFQVGEFSAGLDVDLLLNLPDVEYLYDFKWTKKEGLTNFTQLVNIAQLTNNTFRLTDIGIAPSRLYIGDFVTNHTIEVVNEFSDYWRRDYLKTGRTTRVRDFDISVTKGPETILVSNFFLNMTEFHNVDFVEVKSSFERILQTYDINKIGDRTKNGTRIEFLGGHDVPAQERTDILASDYYLAYGEVDTISVTYRAPESLKIKIVDKINNALRNADVKLNFGNSTDATFGTMISEELILPCAYKISDFLGYVEYPEVPRGNYTVDVFYQNKQVAYGVSIDTYTIENIVFTTIPHFPTWVIIFSVTSAVIGIVGYIIIKKAQS